MIALCALALLRADRLGAGDVFDGLEFYGGKDLYDWCRSADPADERACEAYICGVLDAWSMEFEILHTRPYAFCLPAGMSCKRLGKTIANYLTRDPTPLGAAGDSAVAYPLLKLFPCR